MTGTLTNEPPANATVKQPRAAVASLEMSTTVSASFAGSTAAGHTLHTTMAVVAQSPLLTAQASNSKVGETETDL